MSVDAAFFATADPGTLLFTGAHAEAPLQECQGLFVENEFGVADVNKFTGLATSSHHVASLDAVTRHKRTDSRRYCDIMGPLGLGDELRAALVVDSQCWGYLCLHREDHELGFAPGDGALISRLGPHIAHGLRQAVLLHGPAGAGIDPRPGVVLLADDDLSVIAMTPEAEDLMWLLGDGPGCDGPAAGAGPRRGLVASGTRARCHGRARPTEHTSSHRRRALARRPRLPVAGSLGWRPDRGRARAR